MQELTVIALDGKIKDVTERALSALDMFKRAEKERGRFGAVFFPEGEDAAFRIACEKRQIPYFKMNERKKIAEEAARYPNPAVFDESPLEASKFYADKRFLVKVYS